MDSFFRIRLLFGDSYKYYFTNFNFNKSPMFANFYGPTAVAALGVFVPTKWLAITGGVLDPFTKADDYSDVFKAVNLYFAPIFTYNIAGLPGQFSPAFNWSNQPHTNFNEPFGPLSLEQIPQAVGTLLGAPPSKGLIVNQKDQSGFFIANFSQYLFLKEDPASIQEKLRSGQALNGIGIFGRFGSAPHRTNPIELDASIALFARGLFNARRYDSFGVGFYYNQFSRDLKNDITLLTAGTDKLSNERGVEVFYDFAITPAVRLIPSYQHIWDPLVAQIATDQDHADIFLTRMTVAW